MGYPKNSKIKFFFDIDKKVLSLSDCIMTDVFFSMNDKSSKKEILQKFQVNENIMKKLCKPDTVFMHCLPANLGEEVSENIFRSKHSIVWKQAENKIFK